VAPHVSERARQLGGSVSLSSDFPGSFLAHYWTPKMEAICPSETSGCFRNTKRLNAKTVPFAVTGERNSYSTDLVWFWIIGAVWWLIYGLDEGGTKVRFMTAARRPDGLWGLTSFLPIGYRVNLLVENTWSYTSISTPVVMSWCLIRHREITTFLPLVCQLANSEQLRIRILKMVISYLKKITKKFLGGWGKPRNPSD
jgi:hypothetical protein